MVSQTFKANYNFSIYRRGSPQMFGIQTVSKGWMSLGSAWRREFFWTFQRNYTFCWCIKYLRILAQNIGFTSTWDSWKGTIHKWRHKFFYIIWTPSQPLGINYVVSKSEILTHFPLLVVFLPSKIGNFWPPSPPLRKHSSWMAPY